MMTPHLSKRTTRQVLVMIAVVVVVIYLPLNIFYIMVSTRRQDSLAITDGGDKTKQQDTHMAVQISNIDMDLSGSKVNIQLSLDVKDLLKFLQGDNINKGEATDHPIPKDVEIVVHNPQLCEQSRKLKYIVYVHTSPENRAKRDMLRSTWLSRSLFNERIIERVFLMGQSTNVGVQEKVKAESEKYGDIIQGKFIDNYRNLTLKGLMGLKWLSMYCMQAKFAIKADDDAFVNIFNLLQMLRQYENEGKRRLLACPLWSANTMPILRDPTKCSKWCVRFNEFPGHRYFPQYCAGLTFVLSQDLVPILYNNSRTTPFFWIDDVYITGLLTSKVKDMNYISIAKNFSLKQDESKAQLQDLNKPTTHLIIHAKKLDEYMPMWKLLLKRLPFDDVKLLSTDIIESNVHLKKTLTGKGKESRLDKLPA